MTTSIYSPVSWLDQFFTDLDRNLSDKRSFAPAVDIAEEKEHFLLRVELPGVPRENLKVEVKDNRLTISGKKDNHWEGRDNEYRYAESSYGAFSRSFALPRSVRGEAVAAEYKDGVLNLRIPKAEESLPRAVEIK